MPMLYLLIHIKLWDTCGERLVSFLQSSWLQGRAPCLCLGDGWKQGDCAWLALLRGECSLWEGGASGAGLGPGYADFHNDPDIMNFCTLGY